MNKPVLIGIILAALVLAGLVITSFGNRKHECQVCMSYQGRTACRKAAASTREEAERAALDNACAQIASGVTATMGCTSSAPVSVRWFR